MKQIGPTKGYAVRIRGIGLAVIFFQILICSAVATQYIAAHFDYDPALTDSWGYGIYNPFAWVSWVFAFYRVEPSFFDTIYIAFLVCTLVTMFSAVLWIGLKVHSPVAAPEIHGSARWICTIEELREIGLVAKPSNDNDLPAPEPATVIYLGVIEDRDGKCYYIRQTGNEHVLVAAPSRTGKGIGPIFMNALTWQHAFAVYDPKGEIYYNTSGWRQTLGKVFRWNPAANDPSFSAFNFLDTIRQGTIYEVSDAMDVATLLVDPSSVGAAEWNHWEKSGFSFLNACILYALYFIPERCGRKAHLGDVYDLITCPSPNVDPHEMIEQLCKTMLANNYGNPNPHGGPNTHGTHKAIAQGGAALLSSHPEERSGIVSTARTTLMLYADPLIIRNTSHSDFALTDIWNAAQPGSLYITISPDQEKKLQGMLRMMLTLILRTAQRPELKYNERGQALLPWRHRSLFLFDEFPTLGEIREIETALARIAGYGVQLMLFVQDVPQLYKEYGEHQTVISGTQTKLVYAPNDDVTAKWLETECGRTTIVKNQISVDGSRFAALMQRVSLHFQETERPLITLQEARKLEPPTKDADGRVTKAGALIILRTGFNPIFGRQLLYFQDPVFAERRAMPPAHVARQRPAAPLSAGALPPPTEQALPTAEASTQ